MLSKDQEFRQQVGHRKRAAVSTLFDYLFLLRQKRIAAYWEARLGEAIVMGEVRVVRMPKETGLRQVHEVAAEVQDALTTSEAVMVSSSK